MSTATVSTSGPTAPTSFVTDTVTVFVRELKPTLREPFSIVFSMVQPLVFLGLFGPLLAGVAGGAQGSLQWFVPGIVVMSCLFGASMTGSNLQMEMQTGSHERMLVSPLSRPALLVGRALKEVVPTLLQAVIIVAVCAPFSFEVHAAGVAVGLVLLAVLCVGLGSFSYALAVAARGQDWIFWTVQQTVLFPLLLLAGMLLPVDSGPGWLQVVSRFNPLRYVVDAERALFSGEIVSGTVGLGLLAAALVAAGGLLVGIRTMRRTD